MKKHYLLILPFIMIFQMSFGQCNNELIDMCKSENGGAKYLKHFRIRFAESKNIKKLPRHFYHYVNKGNEQLVIAILLCIAFVKHVLAEPSGRYTRSFPQPISVLFASDAAPRVVYIWQ